MCPWSDLGSIIRQIIIGRFSAVQVFLNPGAELTLNSHLNEQVLAPDNCWQGAW